MNSDISPRNTVEFLGDLALLGSSAIWGVGISQTFRFFLRLHNEPLRFVLLVAWLCLVDTLRECLTTYSEITLYLDTIVYFPVTSGREVAHVMPFQLSAIVAGTAQSFFAFRIWIMSDKKWYIPFVATPAVCFQLCVPPIYFSTISLDTVPEITQKRLLVASLAVGAAIDVFLSAGLCILLWKNYMTEGPVLKSTKLLLKRTILFSINTGMWTALSACFIIMIFLRTQTSDYMVFSYFHIMSPIYFATVLANLNARPYLRKQSDPSLPSNLSGLGSSNEDVIRNPEAGEILGNIRSVVNSEIGHSIRDRSPSMPNAGSISSASGKEMAMPVV